jgi:hypothetical protein
MRGGEMKSTIDMVKTCITFKEAHTLSTLYMMRGPTAGSNGRHVGW